MEGSNKEQRIIAGSSVPNKILLVQNLPADFDSQMLGALFQQCPGSVGNVNCNSIFSYRISTRAG